MDEKKEIGQLFDRIAGTYDRFNHLLSLNIDKRWRRRAAACLKLSDEVLDVAVGTADLAIEMLRQERCHRVVGLDLSAEMMRLGKEKADKRGLANKIDFQLGSALAMPYDDGRFDAVTCAYGVRNFSDLDKGLSEMFRVMKAGGQLVILEFSYPSNRLIRGLYDFFFSRIMPLVGRLISKDPTAYLYFRESVKGFIWGDEMLQHLRQAGFQEAAYKPLTFGITTLYTATKPKIS